MTRVFADTFYWVALANPGESRHRAAVALDISLGDIQIYTTDEVLAEFLTFYAADPWQRSRAASTVRVLFTHSGIHVVPQSRESFLAGLDFYLSSETHKAEVRHQGRPLPE